MTYSAEEAVKAIKEHREGTISYTEMTSKIELLREIFEEMKRETDRLFDEVLAKEQEVK